MATKKSTKNNAKKQVAKRSVKKSVKKKTVKKKPVRKAVKKSVKRSPKKASFAGKKTVSSKKSAKNKASSKKPRLSKDMLKIKEELIKDRDLILQEIVRIKEDSLNKSQKDASGDLSGYSFHMADMATDLYDREFLLSLAEGEREILYSLEEAIKKIDEGSYGKCETCNCRISKHRLRAMPQAQNCIKCQEIKEKSLDS